MKLIINIWRKLHYNAYRFNAFNQIYGICLPFTLLERSTIIKKLYKKRGINNPELFFKKILTDPKNSTVIWLSDVFMCFMIILLVMSIMNLISSLLGIVILGQVNKLVYVLICLLPSLSINYYALWKNDKYLIYFKEFEKEPKAVKRKWAWISFGIVLGIVLLLVFSFWVMVMFQI